MSRPTPDRADGKETIGLLGCGRMGRPILGHLLSAGWAGSVLDVNPAAAEGLPSCHRAATARAVGDECDVVFGCLPTAAAYHDALFGNHGLVEAGRVSVYVHLGTSGSGDLALIADKLGHRGIDVVDAPVTGGVARAIAGTLVTLLAGPAAAVSRVKPLIERYSTRIVEFGSRPGLAQTAKLINNMMSAANLAIAVEGLLAGSKAGLPVDRLFEVLSTGTAKSDALLNKVAPHILPRTFDWGSSLEVIAKDMAAWKEMADDQKASIPISRLVHQTYSDAIAALGYREDMTSVAKYLERIEGVLIGEVDEQRK